MSKSLYQKENQQMLPTDFQSRAVETTDNFQGQFMASKLNVIFGGLLVYIFLDRQVLKCNVLFLQDVTVLDGQVKSILGW